MPNRPAVLPALLGLLLIGSLLAGCAAPSPTHPSEPVTPTAADTSTPEPVAALARDLVVLSIEENGYAHLFLNIPGEVELTRITAGDWNDITPAVSPDGSRIAFASNRGGFYDLYLLDLQSGGIQRLTETEQFDSSPTWSPDLAWIAYTTYADGSLEVALYSLADPEQGQILLTENAASDHSPAWAPNGRQIVFVSDRSGDSEIWLADLDINDDTRFRNLSNSPQSAETHPAWDAQGKRLVWASDSLDLGYSGIYVWEVDQPSRPAQWIGDGDWPAWNAQGNQVIALLDGPNQQYLTAYTLDGRLLLAPFSLPGRARGLIWPNLSLPEPLPDSFTQAAAVTPAGMWSPVLTPVSPIPNQRWYMVDLPGVQAPYPQLHDLVDEAFTALRERAIQATGWDALGSLENAFVPITTSLDPGYNEDWLYTGRAFAINSLMINAGWMAVVREQIGTETYWRLYLRAQRQDGSLGEPIQNPPWDLNARYELDPRSYEAGGRYAPVPSGYWVDVTSLAQAYGWQRLPALPNWQNYFAGARFTEFAMPSGLDWYAAMLELYPAEVLATPTRVLPPTATPSRTPVPTSTPGPSRTPRPTGSPTNTRTPRPPTVTPTPSNTPPPSVTPPTVVPTFE
ncbi:MAG: TolB family protein [Chloroflexi bacterium]|nr:TolB family protein [Chloroflexota bacterium]